MTPGPGDDTGAHDDPLVAITGDPEAATLLRRNLETVADQHRDTAVGRLVADVLAGRRPPADLGTDPGFLDLTRAGVQQYRDHVSSLGPEERAALSRQADALADRPRPAPHA